MKVRRHPHRESEVTNMRTNNPAPTNFGVGDEISYAVGSGMVYGQVVRLLEDGQAIEILFEDGRREVKRSRDRAVRLLRRSSGKSEIDERHSDRSAARDREIDEVRRSDVRRR